MSDLDGSESSPRGGRATPLWVGAVVLVAAATGILILSSDARLLRLGLVAALWAALIAAFAVAKLRGRITDDEDRAADLQQVYELELEREVAARREFELEAENEARRQVAEEHHNEVQALRAELNNLRQSLEQMLGGDVLFERVALRAESTRVRSLTEQGGATGNGRAALRSGDGWGRELPAGYQGHIDTGSWPAGRSGAVDSGSHPVTPHSAQPHSGQSYPSRPYPAQSYPAESYPAQSYPAESYPAQPDPGREYPVQPHVDQNSAFQNPGPTYPASGHPVPDHPAPARSGRPHPGPDNSRTVNGRLADDEAQPNTEMMARPAGEQPPVDNQSPPNQSPPNQSQPDPSRVDAPAGQQSAGQHQGDQPPAERQHGTVPRSKPQQARGRSASAKATPPSARAEPPPPGSAPKKRTPKPFLKSSSRTGTDSPRETPPADAGPEKSETQAEVPNEQGSPQVVDGAHTEGTSVTELLAAYGNSGESKGRRRRRG